MQKKLKRNLTRQLFARKVKRGEGSDANHTAPCTDTVSSMYTFRTVGFTATSTKITHHGSTVSSSERLRESEYWEPNIRNDSNQASASTSNNSNTTKLNESELFWSSVTVSHAHSQSQTCFQGSDVGK